MTEDPGNRSYESGEDTVSDQGTTSVIQFNDLLLEKRDHVAVITFNRPEKLNAFRNHTNFEMLEALEDVERDESIHVLIITGRGRGFCTGHDMHEGPEDPAFRLSRHARGRKFSEICEKLLHLRQPVVAAINGWCAAGGLGFALCCDVLIASEEANFYNPQIAFGYPSVPGIGALLHSYISAAWTKDLVLGGRSVDANTAERIGLVSRVVPSNHLMDEALATAIKMSEVPPDIMAMQREMMNSVWLAAGGTGISLIAGRHTAIAGHSLPEWEEREANWKTTTRDRRLPTNHQVHGPGSDALALEPSEPPSWKITDEMINWVKSLVGLELKPRRVYFNTEATRDAVRHFVNGIGDPNPLYRDDEYARRTQYGRIVAPPSFLYSVYLPGGGMPNMGNWLPPGNGMDGGNDWELYQPILQGDALSYVEKITNVEEKQTRKWGRTYRIDSEVQFRNQRDELVAKGCGWVFRLDPVEAPADGQRPIYEYTNKDLQKIVEAYKKEFIQGQTPRFWEDVEIGEDLPSVVRGPLNQEDLMSWVVGAGTTAPLAHHAIAHPDIRPDWKASLGKPVDYSVLEATWIDPEQREHYPVAMEHVDAVVGEDRGVGAPFDFGPQRISWLMTLLTNWQGDDGFLNQFRCELRDVNQLGDTTWLKGKVIGKRLRKGKPQVEIECYGENQLGTVTMVGNAVVTLPMRAG